MPPTPTGQGEPLPANWPALPPNPLPVWYEGKWRHVDFNREGYGEFYSENHDQDMPTPTPPIQPCTAPEPCCGQCPRPEAQQQQQAHEGWRNLNDDAIDGAGLWFRDAIQARLMKGREEYGPIFVGAPLAHAMEEALDLAIYLWVALRQQGDHSVECQIANAEADAWIAAEEHPTDDPAQRIRREGVIKSARPVDLPGIRFAISAIRKLRLDDGYDAANAALIGTLAAAKAHADIGGMESPPVLLDPTANCPYHEGGCIAAGATECRCACDRFECPDPCPLGETPLADPNETQPAALPPPPDIAVICWRAFGGVPQPGYRFCPCVRSCALDGTDPLGRFPNNRPESPKPAAVGLHGGNPALAFPVWDAQDVGEGDVVVGQGTEASPLAIIDNFGNGQPLVTPPEHRSNDPIGEGIAALLLAAECADRAAEELGGTSAPAQAHTAVGLARKAAVGARVAADNLRRADRRGS